MSTPPQPHQPNWSPVPYGPPAPPPQKPSRRKAWLTHGGVAFAALIVGAGIGGSGGSGEADAGAEAAVAKPQPAATVTETAQADPAPTVTETVTAQPKKPKKTVDPGPASSFAGDGEYLVGEDIGAGTYKTAGSEDSLGCYWARLKNASGEFDAIIANNNLTGPGRVTLRKGEYFQTQRCQEWKKVG